MKLRRRTKLLLASGAVLLSIQVVTYLLFAEQAMPVAALSHLDAYRCLAGMQFAYVPYETWDALTEAQRRALARELKRHVPAVYHSHRDIPEASLYTKPLTDTEKRVYQGVGCFDVVGETVEELRAKIKMGRHVVGYKDGARIEWQLAPRGPFWMESGTSIRLGYVGGESRSDIYVWLFGWWVRVWNVHRSMP